MKAKPGRPPWRARTTAPKMSSPLLTTITFKTTATLIIPAIRNRIALSAWAVGVMPKGYTVNIMSTQPLDEKWRAFGWDVLECGGHDISSLIDALKQARVPSGRPKVIIANTTKGKGVSFMENNPSFHGKAPSPGRAPAGAERIARLMTQPVAAAATREAMGPTLARLAREGLDIVAVDADLGVSTTAALFGKEFPDRFFPVGVAEQNMIGVAAGLAAEGKITFASSFAVFMPGHCFDQIRMAIAQPHLNVKLVASHGGIVTGEDGASAQAIEDLALMLSLPGFNVIVPADLPEAEQAIEAAARTEGPFYIRTGRPKIPVIHDSSYRFQLGKAEVLRPGKDVTVAANGVMVKAALDAAELLAHEGIDCRVLNVASLRPLDEDAIAAAARETGAIVTAEDHYTFGGLASVVGADGRPRRILCPWRSLAWRASD